jgi:hypothetical protein
MKRNLVIVFSLLAISTVFFTMCLKIKTNAQTNQRPSPASSNSNQKVRSNMNASNAKQSNNPYQGNAFVSNTGELIAQPMATGSEITTLDDVGVTMIFPKGYEIYDVAKMYDYEAKNPNRLFDTRVHLHATNTDWGIELMVYTSHNLSFEESVKNTKKLLVGNDGYRVLRSNVKSTINGIEVISSNGLNEHQAWRFDVFRTPRSTVVVFAIGFPEDMKKNQASVQSFLQSIKLK